jgi:hypothetical protein
VLHTEETQVISAARRLLADGEVDQARTLLLEEGYMRRSQPGLQAAYLELIPPTPTLRDVLATLYQGIDDPTPAVRRRTVTRISAELSRTALRDNVRWMQDPRAVDPLITAAADTDAVVRERALGALMRLVSRYFPDQRAAPAFVGQLGSKRSLTRHNVISGIGCLRNEALLQHLVVPFEQGSEADRVLVAQQVEGLGVETPYHHDLPTIEWTPDGRRFWRTKMMAGLEDPSAKVRMHVARALQHLGDGSSAAALMAARATEPDADARYYMGEALAACEARSAESERSM